MDSVGDQPHGLGLPHSEIRESTSARLSSRLIAACHVLHRLSVPRHPPDALITLNQRSKPLSFGRFPPANSVTRRDKAPLQPACNRSRTKPPANEHRSSAVKTQTVMITSFSPGSDQTSNRLSDKYRRTKPMDLTDPSVHTYPQ